VFQKKETRSFVTQSQTAASKTHSVGYRGRIWAVRPSLIPGKENVSSVI